VRYKSHVLCAAEIEPNSHLCIISNN